MVNANDAVYDWTHDCANVGLDIKADLDGTKHFGGPANQDAEGNYYLMGMDGYMWTNSGVGSEGFMWTNGFLWTDGFMWTNAYLWTDGSTDANGYLWTDGFMWTNAYMWTNGFLWTNAYMWTNALTEPASINTWVPQE